MIKLFLDDERTPLNHTEWIIVRNFNEFVKFFTNNPVPDLVSFDHDLGGEKDGKDCVNWLVENNILLKQYLVHSSNPPGAENIHGLLKQWLNHNNVDTKNNRIINFIHPVYGFEN